MNESHKEGEIKGSVNTERCSIYFIRFPSCRERESARRAEKSVKLLRPVCAARDLVRGP